MHRIQHTSDANGALPEVGGELLVALDGTGNSEIAIPIAVTLARWLGCSLHLAHIVASPVDVTTGWGAVIGDGRHAGTSAPAAEGDVDARELRALAAMVQGATHVPVSATTTPGDDVAARLIEVAHKWACGAIVLRTRAQRPLARAVFGSVTARLLHDSPIPVIIVPARAHAFLPGVSRASVAHAAAVWASDHGGAGGWTVVVALDGTPESEQVVEHLAGLAVDGGAHLALTHVTTPGDAERAHVDAVARLAALADRLGERGWSVSFSTVRAPDVASGIAEIAAERSAAMIALRGSGHGALHRLAHGSTIDLLARVGELPLWVVPHRMWRLAEDA